MAPYATATAPLASLPDERASAREHAGQDAASRRKTCNQPARRSPGALRGREFENSLGHC